MSKNDFSYILILGNTLHYASYGANNKMQLTLNKLQKRSFKTTQCQKSWCGLSWGMRSCWSSLKISLVMKIFLMGTFLMWPARLGLFFFFNHKEILWSIFLDNFNWHHNIQILMITQASGLFNGDRNSKHQTGDKYKTFIAHLCIVALKNLQLTPSLERWECKPY